MKYNPCNRASLLWRAKHTFRRWATLWLIARELMARYRGYNRYADGAVDVQFQSGDMNVGNVKSITVRDADGVESSVPLGWTKIDTKGRTPTPEEWLKQ